MHKINNIFFIIQNNYTKQNFYAWHIYLVNKLHNQSNIVHKHLRKKTQKKKKNDPTKFALRNAWGIQSILRSSVS